MEKTIILTKDLSRKKKGDSVTVPAWVADEMVNTKAATYAKEEKPDGDKDKTQKDNKEDKTK